MKDVDIVMSNELSVFGNKSYEEIAAELGANIRTDILPSLKINKLGEDDAGNPIPPGSYVVSQNGHNVYSKTAAFRVYLNTFQYMRYDDTTNKFVNKSLIIKNFYEEAHDELGGLKCGKIAKKDFEFLSDAQKEDQRSIKCYRLSFGTVSFPNSEVINLPVMWRSSGLNFNTLNDPIKKMEKMKHVFMSHYVDLSLKREKTGANVYYVAQAELNVKDMIPITKDDLENLEVFQSFIKAENNKVLEKWRTAKKLDLHDHEGELSDALGFDDHDIDDEIPF